MHPKHTNKKCIKHYANLSLSLSLSVGVCAGVTSYQVDLETKTVVVIGDVVPFEVLESVSKVKSAELWTAGI